MRVEQSHGHDPRALGSEESPSAACTIEPFISMCHDLANESGSSMPASSASRAYDRADVLEVRRARLSDRIVQIGDLEQDVDERAALEVVAVKPLVEDVEDREQLLLGSRPSPSTPRPRRTRASSAARVAGGRRARGPAWCGSVDRASSARRRPSSGSPRSRRRGCRASRRARTQPRECAHGCASVDSCLVAPRSSQATNSGADVPTVTVASSAPVSSTRVTNPLSPSRP